MHLGIVEKLKNKGLNGEQIQEYLKNNEVLEKIVNVAGTTFTLNPELKKNNFLEKLKNNLFNRKTENLDKSKYKYIEKKVLINLNDVKVRKYYSTCFKEELYYYITKTFKDLANFNFQQISTKFNKEVEVVSNDLLTDEIVKGFFIKVYRDTVDETSLQSKLINTIDNLPEHKGYFYYLKQGQNQIINSLDNYPDLINSYLDGKEDFIKMELLSKCKIIEDIIEFDYRYKFLIALNKKYNLEDASKEIVAEKNKEIYTEFSKLFNSVDVVVFTFNKIDSFKIHLAANISSLYYALFERNLVSKNKTEFQRYVSKIHNIKFGKIREDKAMGLTPHKKRINQFLEEIDVHFPSQKA